MKAPIEICGFSYRLGSFSLNVSKSVVNFIMNLIRNCTAFMNPRLIDSPTGKTTSADISLTTKIRPPPNKPSYKFVAIIKVFYSSIIDIA